MQPKYHHTFLCGGVVLAVLNFHTKKSKPVMFLSQVSIDSMGDRYELLKYNSFHGYLFDEISTT